VLAGALLAGGAWPPLSPLLVLVAASLGLYHGGMALNDWADRGRDARERPGRPLPSGAVRPGRALALGLGLPAAGVAAASLVSTQAGLLAAVIALLVLVYDLGTRGPLLGPLLLGLARAAHLSLGILLGLAGEPHAGFSLVALVVAPLGYGAYVLAVSRLGRLEDASVPPAPERTRRLLGLLAGLLVLVPATTLAAELVVGLETPPLAGAALALALALAGARGLLGAARADPRSPEAIVRAMGLALRRLLVVTSSLAVLPGTPSALACAVCILAGYPLSHALRRIFPPS